MGGTKFFIFFVSFVSFYILCAAHILILPNQSWKFSDGPVSSDWTQPDFDDRAWLVKQTEFPLYSGSRYYRFSVTVNTSSFQTSGSAMFCVASRDVSSLFLNGRAIFERLNTTLSNTRSHDDDHVSSNNTDSSSSTTTGNYDNSTQFQSPNRCFQYSIPIHWLQSTITLAVQSDSAVTQPIADRFDLTLVAIPETSNRLGESVVSSLHNRDYYSNPLEKAWDGSRVSFWKSIGDTTEFVVTFEANR